jgi:hypothetical protein
MTTTTTTTTTITLRNSFHNTTCRVRAGYHSRRACQRIRAKLCGIEGCLCGEGPLPARGPQGVPSGMLLSVEVAARDGAWINLYPKEE